MGRLMPHGTSHGSFHGIAHMVGLCPGSSSQEKQPGAAATITPPPPAGEGGLPEARFYAIWLH